MRDKEHYIMKKSIAALGAAVAVAALLVIGAPSAASAYPPGEPDPRECVPVEPIPAVPGTPAVGEPTIEVDNPDYVPGVPASSSWWNFAPNKDQGPFDGPPAFPEDERGTWEGPHTEGGPGQDQVGVFQQGNGHGSWFYRETIPATDPVGDPTIEIPNPDYVPATPGTPAVPGVECPVIVPPSPGILSQTAVESTLDCEAGFITTLEYIRYATPFYVPEINDWNYTEFGEWEVRSTLQTPVTEEQCPPVVEEPEPEPEPQPEPETPVTPEPEPEPAAVVTSTPTLAETGGPDMSWLLYLALGFVGSGVASVFYTQRRLRAERRQK